MWKGSGVEIPRTDGHTDRAAVESPRGPRKQEPSWEAAAPHWARLITPALRPWGREAAGSGVQEAVESVVGRLQVEEHLAYLGVIQLVGGGHAAEGLQPGRCGSAGVRAVFRGIPRATRRGAGTYHWLTVWRPSKSGGRWLMRCIVSISSRRSG